MKNLANLADLADLAYMCPTMVKTNWKTIPLLLHFSIQFNSKMQVKTLLSGLFQNDEKGNSQLVPVPDTEWKIPLFLG